MGGESEHDEPRQAVVKAPGRARRAKLTPAPDTDPSPEAPVGLRDEAVTGVADAASATSAVHQRKAEPGENDERLRRDRPPHW
jgi:hypothetical protein